jgi:hypothetical protein
MGREHVGTQNVQIWNGARPISPWHPVDQIGGYRALHDRGDVTVGNEMPGWPSPTPSSATTT